MELTNVFKRFLFFTDTQRGPHNQRVLLYSTHNSYFSYFHEIVQYRTMNKIPYKYHPVMSVAGEVPALSRFQIVRQGFISSLFDRTVLPPV